MKPIYANPKEAPIFTAGDLQDYEALMIVTTLDIDTGTADTETLYNVYHGIYDRNPLAWSTRIAAIHNALDAARERADNIEKQRGV